jgi:signal transduction histidine kinase
MTRPRHGRNWSIRARMVALALVSVTPLIAIYFWQNRSLREQSQEDAYADTVRLARVASGQQASVLDRTRAVMESVIVMAPRAWSGEDCEASLQELQTQIQDSVNVMSVDPNGQVLCSAAPLPADALDLSDRFYVQDALQLGEFVGEIEPEGVVVPSPVLMATLPIADDTVGLVIAALEVGADLDVFVEDIGLPPGSTAGIIDDRGTIVASTLAEDVPGETWSVTEIVDQVSIGSAEGTVTAEGADGVTRVYSYADVEGSNQTVFSVVGVPTSEAFATANEQARTNLIAGGIVAVLAVLAAIVMSELSVARPVHTIVGTVRKLGAGDLDARTGTRTTTGEIGELARSIDEMAGDLQERDQSLREAAEEREGLLSELLTAQEVERGRIAADIHDDTIQTMIAAGMEVQLLRRHLDEGEALERGDRLDHTIHEAIGRLRQLMFDLEPPLAEAGLEEGIELYLEGVLATTPVDIVVQADGATQPEEVARHVLYRNIREAALNAVRHGGADRLDVNVQAQDGGIMVTIEDNGRGFDASQAPPAGHHGMRTMRERTVALGGRFDIDSEAGHGTTVRFWLPG